MKYMGSKNRLAKHILPIMEGSRGDRPWVEPFVGGANMIDKVTGVRIGGDANEYVAAMLSELSSGWVPRDDYSKEEYLQIRDNKSDHPAHVVGWVGVNCSYCGKWFGGFAGSTETKDGIRDYQKEAHRNAIKQAKRLEGVRFEGCSYDSLDIPEDSLIYCDPPYAITTGYANKFDHEKFWKWCREKAEEGHIVYVSEYNAPTDFEVVWEREVSSSLSANGRVGHSKKSVEKLFKLNKDFGGC